MSSQSETPRAPRTSPGFGCRIGPGRAAVDRALLLEFTGIPVACISDVMSRMAAGGPTLRPMGSARLCGTALTVRVPPGDNLMMHKAIQIGRPGDVVVVDAGGDLTNAITGERMVTAARAKGLAGFVINGAVRDSAFLRQCDFPVFAAGVTHRGPYKNGPGEINFPLAINGMVINSGDVIVGDDDGVLCIPIQDAATIAIAAREKADQERDTPATEGDRSWIDATLRRIGCEGL